MALIGRRAWDRLDLVRLAGVSPNCVNMRGPAPGIGRDRLLGPDPVHQGAGLGPRFIGAALLEHHARR